MQEEHGNKWTLIASKLPGRTDSAAKNFFYASLRKAIRIINSFVSNHRSDLFYKNIKIFK
jgi:hypothetical protein